MAMLKKLTLIKRVASTRFGALMSFRIFSSFFVSEVLNSSISVGVREKKADSAADTNATSNKKRRMNTIANNELMENDVRIMLINDVNKKQMLLGSYKVRVIS